VHSNVENNTDFRKVDMQKTQNELEWLAATKLLPPILNPEIVQRTRLIQTLKLALTTKRLVIISAPAGSGKTTLLTSLYQNLPELPLA